MNLIDVLHGEHGVFYALFQHMDQKASQAENLDELRSLAAALKAALVSHATLENELFFPALERHLGPAGPLSVMRSEHEEIDRTLEEAERASRIPEATGRLRQVLQLAREHFAKEEQVLFRMAETALGDDALARLGRRWVDARHPS